MDSFYISHKWSLSLEGVSIVTLFSESENLNFWQFYFFYFSALTLKKNSTVLNGFFPYLAQMITSMRGCVAYNDLWPWPISSGSFGLGLENRVRSLASTVLDGFFPYLVQMFTSMRRGVACDDLSPWPISSRSFDLDFENRVCSVTFSFLDRLSSGVPDLFDRNKILSGGDLSHYQVPHCIRVFFYFVWFVFIHHNFQSYFELCTYCSILDIYLS